MVSIDQVLLLEQKVESAVGKIQQLQAENAALKQKVLELTNALSSKSEQLTTYENDQNKIENGIRKALERLNTIENSVLKAGIASNTPAKPAEPAPVVVPVAVNVQQSFHNLEEVPENEESVESSEIDPAEDINDDSTVSSEASEFELSEPEVEEEITNDAETGFNDELSEDFNVEPEVESAFDFNEAPASIDDAFSQTGAFNLSDDFSSEDIPEDSVSESEAEENPDDLDFDIF